MEFLIVDQHLGFSAHRLVYDCVLPGSTTVPALRGALSEAGARCCPIPMGSTEGALKKWCLYTGDPLLQRTLWVSCLDQTELWVICCGHMSVKKNIEVIHSFFMVMHRKMTVWVPA